MSRIHSSIWKVFMSLEMRHLKVVAAVAEEGSVTRAATRLHLTQSALSHQLRDAEDLLGRRLFERRSRKMILTPAGERLLRSARAVMDEIAQAEKEISGSKSETHGVVRLTTQCYTAYHWLPSRLKRFQKKYPAVEVELVPEATSNPFEPLLGERLDIAITHAPVRNRKIHYTPLFRDEMVVIVAPGHQWAAKPFVSAEDFADEDLIIYPPKSESSVLLQFLNPARIAPRRIREVMLTEAIVALVKERMGVAVVTRWSVAPQLASGELAAVRLTRAGFYREWSVAQLRSKSKAPYLEDFIQLLAQNPLHLPDGNFADGKNHKTASATRRLSAAQRNARAAKSKSRLVQA
jgi:LysR family transcriptional regulator for metE and metH